MTDTTHRANPENDREDAFRVDLERLRFSPYFSRLSAVTQVIPQAGSGTVIHNRLTHSLKVTAVARSIAVMLRGGENAAVCQGPTGAAIEALGGCDPVVVQSAAIAHDLGHPPFGHLGEQALDRVARTRLGLADGFEGNAQTFRIITALDTCEAAPRGLNLTAAVRSAVLKYPWTREAWRAPAAHAGGALPRGVGTIDAVGARKFSAYTIDAAALDAARAAYPAIGTFQQTVECSVMDIADDIAYAVHDLDDFYRAGILQYPSVAAEFSAWLRHTRHLAELPEAELERTFREPGRALELTWRRLRAKDAWIADEQAFRDAVLRVRDALVEGLLATPYDNGLSADHAIDAFTKQWIDRLKAAVCFDAHPDTRSGHVRLTQEAWHDVVVLKFVHARFVLDRSDLAIYQRGQAKVIAGLVEGFWAWLSDPDDAPRAPRKLTDLVEVTVADYRGLAPGAATIADDPVRLGRARAVVDYIASFTDAQALSAAALIGGTSDRLWEDGRSL